VAPTLDRLARSVPDVREIGCSTAMNIRGRRSSDTGRARLEPSPVDEGKRTKEYRRNVLL
jgi:hypothetical protein